MARKASGLRLFGRVLRDCMDLPRSASEFSMRFAKL